MYSVWQLPTAACLVRPWNTGGDLSDYIAQTGSLVDWQAQKVLRQLCLAVDTGCRRSCVSLRKSRDCASRCGDSCVSMRKLAESMRTPSQNCFKISYSSYSLVKYCAHGTSDILMVMYAVFLFHITRFYPRT